MPTVREITYRNVRILSVDVSDTTATDYAGLIQLMETAKELIASKPPNSVLCLNNVGKVNFNNQVLEALQQYMEHNRPYIKKAAVIGLDGLKKIVFKGIIKLTHRDNIRDFEKEQEALDWLAATDAKGKPSDP